MSLMSPALAGRFFTTSTTWKPQESQVLNPICMIVNKLLGSVSLNFIICKRGAWLNDLGFWYKFKFRQMGS